MELNKEIRDILIEFAMIIQEENYTSNQVLTRSTYDTFRIQNIVEKLSIHDVSNSFCDLYKKKCMGGFCSVTPFPEKCKYLKHNDC